MFAVSCNDHFWQEAGLLMRPEPCQTKAKTENRECKTKTATETETEKLLWDRDQKLRDRDQYDQFICTWK